ncbi:isopeptide-forming domain-containing fimbrial protein [Frisingicoccus sp.]|uniref:isopeptide-forming domain-containing fimbrial protein n=1 Tax=Frisingicoccus sp. TaxID=1918627 RepID=UPI003AB210CA
MKHVKKLLSAVLVLVLALTMVLPVAAAEDGTTYSIKIKNDNDDHTYEAYQIFAGDLATDENGATVLSNITWGSGVNSSGLGEAKDYAATITESNAAEKAKELAGKLTSEIAGTANAKTNISFAGTTVQGYEITGLTPGYYLVKDKDGSLDANEHDAYTAYILQVVQDVEATPKSSVPSVDKEVKDNVDGTENEEWREDADHAINEPFQFKLTATLPADANFADYATYEVVFKDTMSAGVTFDGIASVVVKKTGAESGTTLNDSQYVLDGVSAGDAGATWSLTINDIKSIIGAGNFTNGVTVEVIYDAHLNENAIKNNASVVGGTTDNTNNNKVELEYSNNPNGKGHGKTPEDYVWVFTYEVDNTKVIGGTGTRDEHGNLTGATPLAGAGFRLYDSTGNTEIGLTFDENLDAYRPIKGDEETTEMTSAETTGKFNIVGLDAGTYILKETNTPDGYNTCADVTITIGANHQEQTSGSAVDMTLNEGSTMNNQIENNKGTTLPGTGGIGTTIFYVVGGILVVGAAVLLIAKKRTRM